VLPANDGRGYVLRRILRRAVRHAHHLGAEDLLLHRLVPALQAQMGHAFPELGRADALITETLRGEEARFRETLARGLHLLDEALSDLPTGDPLPGDVAFKLYDTYGFPLDLTEDALRAQGRSVDRAGFEAAMAEQKAKARAAWTGSGDTAEEGHWFALKESLGQSRFTGYERLHETGELAAIVRDGQRVPAAEAGETVALILPHTPFYAESGGQVGDTGWIEGPQGRARIDDVKKRAGGLWVHHGEIVQGRIAQGEAVALQVDGERRNKLRANHSATHLLHAALRHVLGAHVAQKGALVAPDRLRFDISHPTALSEAEIAEVEALVNAQIRGNAPVGTAEMGYDEALQAGALALFGEKYGDQVRVVSMGQEAANDPGDAPQSYSVELCGGTHVARLGDIGLFKIVSEGGVSAGVRRIEALTGEAARRHLLDQEQTLKQAAAALKVAPADLVGRLQALTEDRRKLERELAEARKALALGGGGGASDAEPEQLDGLAFLGRVLDQVPPKDLRGLADGAKNQLGSGIVAFVTVNDGKASLLVGVTEDLTGRVSAVDLVRAGAQALGGKGGGGRPDMAQAGGPDGDKAAAALDAIRAKLREAVAA